MLSANRGTFISSHPICLTFISFSRLTALARTACAMLNRHGKSKYPCLIPDLRKKHPVFHHQVWYQLRGFTDVLYLVEAVLLYAYFVECFITKDVWLCQMLFLLLLRWSHFCPLIYSPGVLHWLVFHMLKQLCVAWINPIWSWYIIHFICFWMRFASILLRSFTSYS